MGRSSRLKAIRRKARALVAAAPPAARLQLVDELWRGGVVSRKIGEEMLRESPPQGPKIYQ